MYSIIIIETAFILIEIFELHEGLDRKKLRQV